jgi:hypothetical protein
LACWEERDVKPGGPARWRISMPVRQTDELQGFADLEALVAALR